MALQTRRSLLIGGAAFFSFGLVTRGEAHAHKHHSKHLSSKKTSVPEGIKITPTTRADIPATTPIGPLETIARWACVLDNESGAVLLDKHAHEAMPPSSLT
ncbi:MAG: hypothetical protein J6U18_02570 [Acetobacter sp.]|nr:hypothetical protein [Acetobacter sp.]